MAPEQISWFPVPELAELPSDIVERITTVQEKSGFVPNIFLALAHRPAEFRAFMAYHDALMDAERGLSKAEREMIVVATSAARSCMYCVVAHGAILRIRAKDPAISERVATNHRQAGLPQRQVAMLDYAVKLSLTPEEIGQSDRDQLLELGFSVEDIWDISAVAALFSLSNRMAHAMSLEPNPEFFTMAREPRS